MTETRKTFLALFKDLTDYQKRLFTISFGPIKDILGEQLPRALRYVRLRAKFNKGESSDYWR